MTNKNMREHLSAILTADKIDIPDMSEHADRAIAVGIAEFWGAYPWTFRNSDTTLTISSSAEEYNLPSDFDSIVSLREQDSSNGLKLSRKIKEDFDELAPKLSAHATGNPQIYTIYRDSDNKTKIAFFPQPSSSTTYYITYHREAPSALSGIPTKMHGGVLNFAAKHAYPFGSQGRSAAASMALVELGRLIKTDKLGSASITMMNDDTSDQVIRNYEWVD